MTLVADGTFLESVAPPGAALKGVWRLAGGSLIWAYRPAPGAQPGSVPALAIYRVVEASSDRVVLRESNGRMSTLSRKLPGVAPTSQDAPQATSALLYLGLAVAGAGLIVAIVRLSSRRRGRHGDRTTRHAPAAATAGITRVPPAEATGEVVEPSDELMAAVWEAVEHGMDMIQVSGGPLRPFLFQWRGKERKQSVLMGESMEDSVAMGKEIARDADERVDGCVLAWDGYVTIAGARSDALSFQAYERGDTVSHLLVQRYEPSPARHFRARGNVALIGQEAPLFTSGASRSTSSWGPFSERKADVHSIVVVDPATGLSQVHFIVTVGLLEEAKDALVESFEGVVSRFGSDPEFGGEVRFVVYSPAAPGAELAPALAAVKSQLDARIGASGLKTARGQAFSVQVLQKRSAF